MAHTVVTRFTNQATRLREMLDKAERLVVRIDGESVGGFLQMLDSIEALMEELAQTGFDVRPEQTRWESLLNRINSHPQPIVRAASLAGGMEQLRAANPPAESFWWHLDTEVMQRRRKAIARASMTLAAIIVVAVAVLWALETFFPPDPVAVAMVETSSMIDRLTAEQEWEQALATVLEARQRLPDQPELAIWEAVLYERLENPVAAERALREAEAMLADQPLQVLVYLGNKRLMVDDLDGAEEAALRGAEMDPNDPQITFLLGSIAEARGSLAAAIEYFQLTFELAQESNPQLAVIARVRMGQLMQSPDSFFAPAEADTP